MLHCRHPELLSDAAEGISRRVKPKMVAAQPRDHKILRALLRGVGKPEMTKPLN
jgi:hypothetical protein